jgi:hypothetical protein
MRRLVGLRVGGRSRAIAPEPRLPS